MEEESKVILSYNLQWFAKDGPGGEKTEPATAKKLREAREDGKVSKSKELTSAFDLIVLFLVLKIFISTVGTGFLEVFYYVYRASKDGSAVFYFRSYGDCLSQHPAGRVEGHDKADEAKAGPL